VNTGKLTIPLLLLLLLTSSASSQQRNIPDVENNLYYRALFASLEKMDKEWGNIVHTDYRNMIVETNREITEGLPSQLGRYRVEYLDSQGLIDRYKKLRKPFAILVSHPMKNNEGRLEISYTVHRFSYGNGQSLYELSDWINVYFRFDCEKRDYVIDEVKLGGI
jgi:hypothetical protein